MMLVKSYLDFSKIQGMGCYAGEYIPKGTQVWRFEDYFDRSYFKEDLAKLAEPARLYVLLRGYYDRVSQSMIFPADNAGWFNHSNSPNVDENDIAVRDILHGEEITQDYRKFDFRGQLFTKE